MLTRPVFQVAVLMRCEALDNRWQPWRWVLEDVVPQEAAFGSEPRRLRESPTGAHWLFPGFTVELFRDDAEGYHLNASSPAPCWFVMWRLEEPAVVDHVQMAQPQAVSLSYHDAGRWMDAQEMVDQVPVPPAVLQALQAFVAEHYQPEPKRRKRPDSFQQLQDRFGNPASISTEKLRGGGRG